MVHVVSSPQQDVLRQGEVIMIVPPARQQVVYVPVYDPQVVYVRPVRPVGNYITFAAGGFSLSFVDNDLDWHNHQVHVPVHHDDHDGRGDRGGGGGSGGDRGGPGGGDRGGRGGPPQKAIFTHDDFKPVIPTKVITPKDNKVVTIPAPTTAPGRGGGSPGRGGGPSASTGGSDHNPATPW